MANVEIATTILNQLGGKRFTAMTGAKEFSAVANGIRFKIGRNKTSGNYVTVVLNSKDLYDFKLERRSFSRKTFEWKSKDIDSCSDVFAENLRQVFEKSTGLYTSLF